MKSDNKPNPNLEEMCAVAIENHLGDISDLPTALANRVREV